MTIKITRRDVIIFILWIVSMLVVYSAAVNTASKESAINADIAVRSHVLFYHPEK